MKTELIKENESIEELGLNGLKIIQSENLYRFTSDAVLLTKFALAKKNEKVADFCAGSGIVGLHFYALHKEVVFCTHAFEIQAPLADMCARTIELNGLNKLFTVHNMPVQEIGKEWDEFFSLILCNPPYERAGSGEGSLSESSRIARHEVAVTLEEIISVASKKVKFGGRLCMCHRADRLTDILYLMRANKLEPKRLRFAGAKNKPPYLVFVEGVKGGKPGIKIELPFEN